MKIALLIESKMKPVPKSVRVVQSYGPIDVRIEGGMLLGEHVIVEGSEDALRIWLGPHDAVRVGKGIPQMEEFEVMHIRSPS